MQIEKLFRRRLAGDPPAARSWLLALLLSASLHVLAAPPPWANPYYTPPPTDRPQPASQQQGETSQPPASIYWGNYQYRPLQQRPGLPPNSSGTPTTNYGYGTPPGGGTYNYSTSPDGSSYSYSASTPNGGYSYSYRIQRRGGYPSYQPGQGSARTATPQQAPVIEASISERRPLVQQNLIYRLLIHSSGNLKEAAPKMPQLDAVVFRQLGKPTSYSSGSASAGQLITEYDYLVIPMRSGTVQLPAPVVTGRYLDNTPFEVSGSHPITLYVQPAPEGVNPWLPLYDLQLEARLSDQNQASAGEPLELEIITTAIGAVGSQLPSVADQLRSDDFYIYPGEVTEEGRISSDGLDLLGSRVERFTLVPRYGGRLTLPAMSIPWWNLRTGEAAKATLPMRQFQVAGPVGESPRIGDGSPGLSEGKHLFFWVPLAAVALILLLGWLKVIFGSGHNSLGDWFGQHMHSTLGRIQQPLATATRRLSPRRHFHRLRTWIGRRLPISWKLWYCLRAVDREEDPASWEHALQILAAKHLGVRTNASLEELADAITACHPAASDGEVRRLLTQLDQAIYGGKPIPSFAQWKADFQRQIKPRLFPLRLRRCGTEKREQGLPSLNPTT